jgi:uncharacterized protein YdcH (DUF465 family)
MNVEEIVKFRNSLANLSLEELNKKKAELQDKIAKMIMDSDVTMQIAIVEAQIQERGK